MRKKTVRTGLSLIQAAVILLIVATFYHSSVAWLLNLSANNELQFTILGIITGGVLGGIGVIVAAIGLLQRTVLEKNVRLIPVMMMIGALIVIFIVLSYTSLTSPEPPQLHPGETITI
jgi:hypothetical protein